MAFSTSSRVWGVTCSERCSTRETVATDTPACSAIFLTDMAFPSFRGLILSLLL